MDFILTPCYNDRAFLKKIIMNIYPCPRCQKPTQYQDNPNRPFCSERCKLIDLGAWADESYKISADDTPFSDELHNTSTLQDLP